MPTRPLKPLSLDDMSWKAILELQNAGQNMLVLPIGATEQHGPHLPIKTDTFIGSQVCAYASEVTQVPVLPALSYTVSSGHTSKWTGTFSLRHETLIDTLEDITDWVVATHWKQLLIVNSHFGNDASMRVAIEKLRLKHLGNLQIAAVNTFQLSDEIWKDFTEDAADLHANKAETDLMLYLDPQSVDMENVEDDPDRTENTIFSYPVAQTSLNGITGSPSRGNANDGERLFNKMGDRLAEIIKQARDEKPPLDAKYWNHLTN